MKIIHAANELTPGSRKVCLAIGVFDGVHLGHQQIIRQTVADARSHDAVALVVTFDQHPNAVVAPERVPPNIYSRSQKMRVIESLGADALLEIPFDKAFSEKSGEEFIRELARDLGKIFSVCVGAGFVFGRQRSGNVALLKTLGAEINFHVHGHAAVALDGETVSSTRIREAIRTGPQGKRRQRRSDQSLWTAVARRLQYAGWSGEEQACGGLALWTVVATGTAM